eukprot:TRINITY_DN1536_c3_g1_i2.p1 TRINITY_DN1536_c3_g1~~TRINITY_DN1536_c3_g1_i2.p1  ORF type:complete len:1084 (-),score=304.60 TRINITY_DN1536_c3_g1_i2:217-3468(-)
MAQSNKTVAKQGVDDLVMLPKVSEDAIVENIRKRYENDLIYTYIGPVLISMNPYKDLKNTGEHLVGMYRNHFPHENPPHCYALAEEAYRAMRGEGLSQCVLISGESGAGKTEAAKIIMSYISFVTGKSDRVEFVKSVVLESNPLLESFGNAKTIRNNNSSRFGKYLEIQFDAYGDPSGGKVTNYLLEKSRVVYQQGNERNFHFFYNLLAGADDRTVQNLTLYAPEYFFYVNQGESPTVDGMNDAEDYQDVLKSMRVVGISDAERENILYIIAGILHLGNLAFTPDAKGNAVVTGNNAQALQLASGLLQVDGSTLTSALTFRVIQTGGSGARTGSTYNVPQNPQQALGAKDALSREIYSRLFDWIVAKINAALGKYQTPFRSVIGILDIYGFEIFGKNGFEQFCINYVNEKLQQYFIELTLKAEQDEYVREGIKWTPIQYFNNQVVVELIEGKVGMFSLLDDICFTIHATGGSSTDLKYLDKLQGGFSSHPHFRSFTGAFQVKHYAGDVTYEVEGFSDKNKDTLFSDLVETVQCSENQFLVSLFPENVSGSAQKKRPTTAGFKIKTSAIALMQALSACQPHYIRCIKPNDNKKYHDWDAGRVSHQVKYLGLLENVRVRRAGFAYRAPFERFLFRYKKLSKKTWGIWGEWSGPPVDGCATICKDLQLDPEEWKIGKTKIFIRRPETLFFLEEQIERKDFECACKIQKAWKKWSSAKKALEQKALIYNLFRGHKERQRNSIGRPYSADYINYDLNYPLQDVIRRSGGQEIVLFADQVSKLNRRNRPERRDFVVTDQAFYIVARATKDNNVIYKLTRRTALADIQSISLSSLQDNYLIMHIPKEYDNLIENDKKTEIAAIIIGAVQNLTGRQLKVDFGDRLTYKIKNGDNRELEFFKNESATSQPILSKAGKTLKVGIASGLPKDTDAAPQLPTSSSGGPPRGGAQRGGPGPARGGPGPARGGPGPARGGPGGPGPAAGGPGPARGGPGGPGGPGPARGGPGPARGGPGGPGPARGGPGPARGGGAAPPKPSVPTATALFDYSASTDDELSFAVGDTIQIIKKDPGGWWEGELNGKRGWVPANHLKE